MIKLLENFILINTVRAATSITERLDAVAGSNYDTSKSSPTEIIGYIVSVLLGILGIIFVVLVITAGYKWMMAGGDKGEIDKAKDTLWRAVIGLIITVSAYAIQQYVFGQLL